MPRLTHDDARLAAAAKLLAALASPGTLRALRALALRDAPTAAEDLVPPPITGEARGQAWRRKQAAAALPGLVKHGLAWCDVDLERGVQVFGLTEAGRDAWLGVRGLL